MGHAAAIAATFALSAVTFAACGGDNKGGGGGGGDRDQIESAIKDYASLDAQRGCDALTDKAIKSFLGDTRAECAKDIVKGDKPEGVEVSDVSVSGDTATAKVTTKNQGTGTFKLVKEGGAWKIDDATEGG
jgi:hypothetical protein